MLVANLSQVDTGSAFITPVLGEVSGENANKQVRLSVEGNSLLKKKCQREIEISCNYVPESRGCSTSAIFP